MINLKIKDLFSLQNKRETLSNKKVKENKIREEKEKKETTEIKKLKKRKIKQKKRKKYKLKPEIKLYIFIILFSIIFVTASFTVLFKIDNIYVTGCDRYDSQEIIKLSGIEKGSNLLLCNVSKAKDRIYNSLPYAEKIKIDKRFPSVLEIKIESGEPNVAIDTNDFYLLISKNGKILEKVYEQPQNILILKGVDLESYNECDKVEYKNENIKNLLSEIYKSIEKNSMIGIDKIDISDLNNITFLFDNRINILIGNTENLDYKIVTSKEIIENKLSKFDNGTLDVSNVNEANKSYFLPNKIQN